jgi:hypothetical protein
VKIMVAYIAVVGGARSKEFAARFVASYLMFPPDAEHELVVVFNQQINSPRTDLALCFLPVECRVFSRSNLGFDIGAYLELSHQADVDLMVCLGQSIYFHRPGWLARLADAYQRHGPGMYGSFTSNLVNPHINTTGFACGPEFLRGYPDPVSSRTDRYNFEHGRASFWRRLYGLGKPVRLVTWDGEYAPPDWRKPDNILWRGDQSNCLMFCSHTDHYFSADAQTRAGWAKGADGPFY